jgi:hypothetical protein
MFIHGIAASENIDSSGERISILGMDISSLAVDGIFNWEHKADQPGQIVGKVLKAKKIFSEQDCEDDVQLMFFQKCGVPYLYVMGELFDDYKESAKEVAGMFRYDADHKETNDKSVMNFSIEGAKIEKQGMDILKSIARKVTLTALPCNKAAIAQMVSTAPAKPKKNSIDELFKTEEIKAEIFEPLKKDQPKLTVAPAPATSIGQTRSGKAISPTAKVHEYGDHTKFSAEDHSDAYDAHINASNSAHKMGDFKASQLHRNKAVLHAGARMRLMDQSKRTSSGKPTVATPAPAAPSAAGNSKLSTNMPYGLKKALDAGSGMCAPSQLTGGAALAKEDVAKPKKKSMWLARAEQEYNSWAKKEQFESFMAKRMPNLTKGEVISIGQVMVLNKSMTLENAIASIANLPTLKKRLKSSDPLNKNAGKDSIYTLIIFDGCELHDILHCSHFATDDVGAYEDIRKVMDEYFKDGVEAHELSFNEAGTLGKQNQTVLFLSEGEPYVDLLEKLKEVAKYKYSSFRPHISVTSNVDEFKGKVSAIVISVNGEIKDRYDFKHEDKIPGGLSDKKKSSDFDPKKLAAGAKVESEHTSDPNIAEEIAMDHLTEDANYYEKLKTVEKK